MKKTYTNAMGLNYELPEAKTVEAALTDEEAAGRDAVRVASNGGRDATPEQAHQFWCALSRMAGLWWTPDETPVLPDSCLGWAVDLYDAIVAIQQENADLRQAKPAQDVVLQLPSEATVGALIGALFGGPKAFDVLHERAKNGTIGKDLGIKEYRAYALHLLAHPLVFHAEKTPALIAELVRFSIGLVAGRNFDYHSADAAARAAAVDLDTLIAAHAQRVADAKQHIADLEAQLQAAKDALAAAKAGAA